MSERPVERTGCAVVAIIVGTAAMAGMDGAAKWLSATYPVVEVVFFRNLLALIPVTLIVSWNGGISALRMHSISLHFARGACILGAMSFFFTALRTLPMADATVLGFTAPLFIVLLSLPVLGERVPHRACVALVGGFIGVVIVYSPTINALRVEHVLPLGKALCFALVMLLTRRMSHTETTASLVFWGTLIPLLGSSLLVPGIWVTPTKGDGLLFLLLGLLGGLSTWLLVFAYSNAPAAFLAPFDYSSILWAAGIGWLVWNVFPVAAVWIGASLIVASCVFLSNNFLISSRE